MVDLLAFLVIVGVWLGLGYLGWANGDAYLKRVPGDEAGAHDMKVSILFGPFNLITFILWGWCLGGKRG